MKNRILPLVLAVCMMAVLLPATALADTATVSKIYITMTALEAGKPLPTNAKTGSAANTEVTKVEWSGETDNGNMISGKDYIATFTVEIRQGRDAAFSVRSITATVNGSSDGVKVTRIDNSKATVTYCTNPSAAPADDEPAPAHAAPADDEPAPAHAATSVSEIEITTSVPAEGKSLPTDARVPAAAGFRVTKVEWTGRTDNGLAVAGVPNPVTFTLEINPGQDAQFDASVRNIYINDEFMSSGWDERVSPTVLKVHYVFPAIGGLDLPGAHSGFTDLDKMSQAEISAYLKNPANPPELTGFDVFWAQPSYTEPYAPGALRANPLAYMSNRLSLMRELAGLDPVMTHYQLGDGAQAAAMLLASSGFSNNPSRPSGMSQSLYDMASKSIDDSTLYHVTSPDNQMVQAIDTLMEGTGRGITTTRGNSIRNLYSRMWLLWPYPQYVGLGYAKNGNDQYVTVDVTDWSHYDCYYDFISWPASGNFPNNLDAFTSSSPWSVYLNPEVYSMPQAEDITVTITRASDGRVWTISGAGSYKTSDEKYFSLNAQKHWNCKGMRLEYSSIVFRPDGIGKYEGEYAVRIDGLKSLGGKDTSLDYTVIFFDADHPNDPTPPTPTAPAVPAAPAAGTAYPSTQTVDIDGKKVEFQMYSLKDENGNPTNYVKVRDLAKALKDTEAKFDVTWDGAVNLATGKSYEPNGTENQTPFSGERAYTVPTNPTKVNGSASDLKAIVLTDDSGGAYTYYQLRDLGKKLGFIVGWNVDKGVFILTEEQISG